MLLMREYVPSLEEETTQHWSSYFQITRKYYKYLFTDLLNIIFDDFGI